MDKPEKSAPCPMCNYPGHLSTYDENTKIATYVCDRCHQIFKEFYKRWCTMIKNDFLQMSEIPVYQIQNDNVTLEAIKTLITEKMGKKGLSVLIKNDEIKSGGLFNSSKTPCIVIYNSNHQKDYIKYCITAQKQGVTTIVTTFTWGYSELRAKEMVAQHKRESSVLGNIFSKGASKTQMIEENFYYQTLEEIIIAVFSG